MPTDHHLAFTEVAAKYIAIKNNTRAYSILISPVFYALPETNSSFLTSSIQENGNYVINMRVPLGKFISLIVKDIPVPMPDSPAPTKYTGLLIGGRGHNLELAIFVSIYNDKDGTKICRPIHPIYRVSVKDFNGINEDRLGDNPLRIKIKGTTGPSNVDITLSNGSSKKVRKKITNTGIFSKSKVIIIID